MARLLHATNIALVALVATLLAAMTAAYLLIFFGEREQRLEQDRWHWERQLGLIDGFIAENLGKHRYQDVEEFLLRWTRENGRVVRLEARFPDGTPLTEYRVDRAVPHVMTYRRDIRQQERLRLTLDVAVDNGAIHAQFVAIGWWFALIALGFTAVLSALIWFIIRRLALHPVEAAWMSERFRQQDEIRKLALVADTTSNAVVITDAEGRIEWVNAAFTRMCGYGLDEVAGRRPGDFLRGPATCPDTARRLSEALQRGESFAGTLVNYTKAGRPYWVEMDIQPIRGEDGRVERFCAVESDVSQRKADEIALKRAASVFRHTVEGILITDEGGTILDVNPAFSEITGYSAAEAIGQTPRILKSDRHDHEFYRVLWHTLEQVGFWRGELWNRRKSGEVFLEFQTITRIPAGADGVPGGYVAIFNDITEVRRKDERIAHLAYHDPLTGLPNRTLLLDRLDQGLAMASRDGSHLAVLFLDLDRFKNVNDTLGHQRGDDLLKVVGERLGDLIRASDTLCRLGGDEFVVVLTDSPEERAVSAVADRIIEAVGRPVELGGTVVQVGTSIGIAMSPTDGSDGVTLMKNADAAMYAAKAAGKNTYRYFSRSMSDKAMARLRLENELRDAVARGQLELYLQPKVCLRRDVTTGVEALLRWHHPELGLVSPAEFIPVAEETGLIIPIGDWVLAEACRIAQRFVGLGLGDLSIAVNVSPVQFQEGHVAERVAALLEQHGVAAASIQVELTEGTVMGDPKRAIDVLGRLSENGVSVAVDDFGTGYSSLSYLRRLPIDTLKIDRSFVKDAHRDVGDAEIVKTIVGLSKSLKLIAIAEGVETAVHADLLRAMDCDLAQGFHFAKPMRVNDFLGWLAAREGREVSDSAQPAPSVASPFETAAGAASSG
ncbi:bifunctional diguanylate cyclase/phosphodiesterase [Magnetospirillum sp. UT-4]|uniref:putative bifunctional diguanylate cyclase/phosphodiesterase n=1 Tax=Magnetospirillum sp. UT-4 TaxID=2681467 RepID=UPI00137CA4DF|nr:bifunctional diguanylate cyclase/phosphodiesterase [Magnetospirillum sp. UT-4]CAA7624159.1 putative Diguanylate cyclase [Magnetospirillum sp. UT-4]